MNEPITTNVEPQATRAQHKIPLSQMTDFIRSRTHVPSAIQAVIDDNRRHREEEQEAIRGVARDISEGIAKLMASSLNLDPHAFIALPDSVARQAAVARTWEAVKDIPGAKINVTYSTKVTINGHRLPTEDDV